MAGDLSLTLGSTHCKSKVVTLIPILIALSQNLYHEFLFRRTLNEQSFKLDNSLNLVLVGDSVSTYI